VVVDASDADHILAQAYDPLYGARPLRRWLEKHLALPLSKLLLEGRLPQGATVTVSACDGRLDLEVVRDAERA